MTVDDLEKYIDQMPDFTKESYDQIRRSKANYRRAGIDIDTVDIDFGNLTVTVRIAQSRLVNGYMLNQKQLVDRAREVFIDSPWRVKIKPVVYSLDTSHITIPWIEDRMEEFGIRRKDLIKQLAIDKVSLSKIFSGTTGLTRSMRALFYYYFMTYELNRDFREE